MSPDLQRAIETAIAEATGETFLIRDSCSVGGGCIHQASLLDDGTRRFFLKSNDASALDGFTAEAEALEALAATASIRVPRPIAHGQADGRAFLVLEALDFSGTTSGDWAAMGSQLAALHRHTAETFGWHRDNFIGATPQSNRRHRDWAVFFREERLRPQFELARRNGFHLDRAAELLVAVDELLAGHRPEPSLLHGDLWSGNAGFLADARPVIYDPAAYYGDRETDLAFSEFFGGFAPAFYEAYRNARPLPPGYADRKPLYNLYHVLNHANLFGSGYARQAEQIIRTLLRGLLKTGRRGVSPR